VVGSTTKTRKKKLKTSKFYREDQARDDHGRFEDEGKGVGYVASTPQATTTVKPGDDTFVIKHPSGASVSGYVKNQDFPGEGIVSTRGEVFLTSVPEAEQGKGLGYSLTKDAVGLLAHHGTKTVNLSPTSEGGKRIVEKLGEDGIIGDAIKTSKSGKAEYPIGRTRTTFMATAGKETQFLESSERGQPIPPEILEQVATIKFCREDQAREKVGVSIQLNNAKTKEK
jgi:hypothetical protein